MNCLENVLRYLNPAQLRAVQHPPGIPLQILAGPGSGKTKVLTSRIAHLILDHSLPPSSICAVTFTNKAAKEMRERLTKLIGKQSTDEVRMGTFHALCALFLRKYAHIIGLEGNFTVCDADESKKIISKLLVPYKDYLTSKDITLKDGTVLSLISKAKAKGHSPDDVCEQIQGQLTTGSGTTGAKVPHDIQRVVAEIYKEYEHSLRKSNSLDFDDLLVYGVKLFSQHEQAVSWCRHVMVDEFQDTNIMQYELMRCIAVAHKCVTVVGDPDQSIYGWRSAEIENLSKMRKDFPTTEHILLEQNYRSTGSILAASIAIVAQDKSRIPKTLHTFNPFSSIPVLRSFTSEHTEASFMAVEIKRLVANMGGMLGWGDFVVLLRFNALSRAVESALQKEGIPSRVLGGHKFFERLEIKDLLAYLQIVDNPQFYPAFSRAINVPSRGIGEKTLGEILSRAEKMKISPLAVVERIYDSKIPDIRPPVKQKLAPFVKTVRVLRDLTIKGTSPADLIRRLLHLTDFENHLKRTQPDWESRWENVQELINFASEVDVDGNGIVELTDPGVEKRLLGNIAVDESSLGLVSSENNPLRLFLQASMLSSDAQDEDGSAEKVTISTCHAAKGLEWPVVMIPAVENGTFPFYRTDDVDEERRLLYVACTRAQGLLYLSHSNRRKVGGETKTKELSDFISVVTKSNQMIGAEDTQKLFTDRLPEFSDVDRTLIAKVLDRPIPPSAEVAKRLAEFNQTIRYHPQDSDMAAKASFQSSNPRFSTPLTFQKVLHPSSNPGSSGNAKPLSPARSLVVNSASTPLHSAPWTRSSGPAQVQNTIHTKWHSEAPYAPAQTTFSDPSTVVAKDDPGSATSHLNTGPLQPSSQFPGPPAILGGKRRLGMGRGTMGYPNKKFKAPT